MVMKKKKTLFLVRKTKLYTRSKTI